MASTWVNLDRPLDGKYVTQPECTLLRRIEIDAITLEDSLALSSKAEWCVLCNQVVPLLDTEGEMCRTNKLNLQLNQLKNH